MYTLSLEAHKMYIYQNAKLQDIFSVILREIKERKMFALVEYNLSHGIFESKGLSFIMFTLPNEQPCCHCLKD